MDYSIICHQPIYVSGTVTFTYRIERINKKLFLGANHKQKVSTGGVMQNDSD
jgi:hypothetical protein